MKSFKRGFTLIELLVVIGIMGLMGTITVGGYRQMQQGMAESTVIDTVEKFLSLAKERALIDRKPTIVYCWNEMLREETEDETAILVGRAVAIRYKGRFSYVDSDWLCDEFGDLEQFTTSGAYADAPQKKIPTRLYDVSDVSNSKITYSLVRDIPQTKNGDASYGVSEIMVNVGIIRSDNNESDSGLSEKDGTLGNIIRYGYKIEQKGNANWKVGSAYGLEFQSIELPHGFVFGSSVPSSMSSPVVDAGTIVYKPDEASSSKGIQISAYKPNNSGQLGTQRIGTANPNSISRK